MLKRLIGIAVVSGLLPVLGVACDDETFVTPRGAPNAIQGEEPSEKWSDYLGAAYYGGMAAYRNEEYGLRTWYTKRWEEYSPEGIDEEVEFYTGFRDPTVDDFQENIVVMLPSYGDISLASLVGTLTEEFQSEGSLVSHVDTTLNGKDGHEWVLSWPSAGRSTFAGQKQRQVVLKVNGGWYQLTCSALAEEFDTHADQCEKMINSLQVVAESP